MNTIIGYTNNRTHAAWCASDRTVISHWKRCKFARPDDIIVIVNNDIKCVVLVAYIAGTCSDTPCSIYAGEDSKYNAHPIPIRD